MSGCLIVWDEEDKKDCEKEEEDCEVEDCERGV